MGFKSRTRLELQNAPLTALSVLMCIKKKVPMTRDSQETILFLKLPLCKTLDVPPRSFSEGVET